MNNLWLIFALIFSTIWIHGQESMPRVDAVRIANLVNFDLEKLTDTPIPTDADVKRPFGMQAGDRGGIVVPECKLTSFQVIATLPE